MTIINKKSGIYRITHMSGMTYVGSSHNLGHRIRHHRRQLAKGLSHNWFFQSLWNQSDHQEWLFEFAITGSKGNLLLEEEQAVISLVEPKFLINLNPIVGSFKSPADNKEMSRKRSVGQSLRWAREREAGIIRKHKPESIEKMRQAATGKTYGPETRAKLSKVWLGKTRPQSTRDKMSAAQKEIRARGKRTYSEETKAKLSAMRMGHPTSDETREKIRIAMAAVWAKRRSSKRA